MLLGFSLMGWEDSQRAEEYYKFAEYVLDVHGKSYENFVVIIGDNTATNKEFARMLGLLFTGCHSHRYNLAMKDIFSDYDHIINKVHVLMQQLSNQIQVARFRKLTHLTAKTGNMTRWSLICSMFDRFFKIREYIFEPGLPKIDDLYPEDDEVKDFNALVNELHNQKSVTKALLDESVTLEEAHALFDAVIQLNPA